MKHPSRRKSSYELHDRSILFALAWLAMLSTLLFGTINLIFSSSPNQILTIIVILEALLIVTLLFLRWGRSNLAAHLFGLTLWAGLSIGAYLNNGVSSPEMSSLVLVMIMVGLLYKGLAGWLYIILSLLTFGVLFYAGRAGFLPDTHIPYSFERTALFLLINLLAGTIFIYFIRKNMNQNLARSYSSEKALEQKNLELEEIRTRLEQRIEERTAQISNEKRYYEALVQNSPMAIVSVDQRHHVISCNPAFERLFGYLQEEMVGKDLDDFVATPETHSEAIIYTQKVLKGENIHAIARRRKKNGELIDVEIHGVPVNVENHPIGVLGLYQDITDQKIAQEALKQSEERFRAFFEFASIGLVIEDLEGKYLQVNDAFCKMVGYTREELIGKNYQEITHPDDLSVDIVQTNRLLQDKEEYYQVEKRYLHKQGNTIWVLLNVSLIKDSSGAPLLFTEQIQDITARKEMMEKLEYLANHDALTGLPNRILYFDRLEHAVQKARRDQQSVAVMFLDLDYFKHINDIYGHDVGDHLLQIVAQRLQSVLRESDTVARFGGDEFAFLLENTNQEPDLRGVIEKIFTALHQPVKVNDHTFDVTPSMGISLYPQDGEEGKTLFMKADMAMYRAKEGGRDQYVFYY
jgi:diguanylate cyclase (GGDEF)-like protein/PAS domain S-box-containing protein